MKYFSKTLVAASLAFGASVASANILNDQSENAELWLSVYDSEVKRTFTADLGLTFGAMLSEIANADYSVAIDLSEYSAWSAFKNGMSGSVKYVVAVAAKNAAGSSSLLITGQNSGFFTGKSSSLMNNAVDNVNAHAQSINDDQPVKEAAQNVSNLVNDGEGKLGEHEGGAGSASLWGTTEFDPNGNYGESIAFNYARGERVGRGTKGAQDVFASQWKLMGDQLTFGNPTVVPVPAAVWMFGSALLGLFGATRKKK